MKFKLTFLIAGLLIVLAACNTSGASSTENELEALKDNHPEIESELEKLPEEFRNEITVPDIDAIPLDDPTIEGEAGTKLTPNTMDIYYQDGKKQLNLWIKNQKDIGVSMSSEPNQQLSNDIDGFYNESDGIRELMWLSKNENALFSIQGVVAPGEESPFNEENMVEIANSIIQQRK